MSGALWFCSHVGLWKLKNRVLKVQLWLQGGFESFYLKSLIIKRVLKGNQEVQQQACY